MPEQDPKARVTTSTRSLRGTQRRRPCWKPGAASSARSPAAWVAAPSTWTSPPLSSWSQTGTSSGPHTRSRIRTACPLSAAGSAPRRSSAKSSVFSARNGTPLPSGAWSASSPITSETRARSRSRSAGSGKRIAVIGRAHDGISSRWATIQTIFEALHKSGAC